MCIFKELVHKNVDPLEQGHCLTKEEFRGLYEIRNLRWKPVCILLWCEELILKQ